METALKRIKVKRRTDSVPSDAELEARFVDLAMPVYPLDDFTCEDIIKANSGRTIKPIEKWL